MAFSHCFRQLLLVAISAVSFLVLPAHGQETAPPEEAPVEEATAPAESQPPADVSADAAPAQSETAPAESAPSNQEAAPDTTSGEEASTEPPAPSEPSACDQATDACTATCKRFDEGDARLAACTNFCQTRLTQCAVPVPAGTPAFMQSPVRPELEVAPLQTKRDSLKALEQNAAMLAAIRAGNLKGIRRLIELDGLSPTYVRTYDYNPATKQFDGRVVRLRLADVFNDTNVLRGEVLGLDKILELFIELGMDIKATLPTVVKDANGAAVAEFDRTAWGPNLKMMESARDRDARLRAFEIALQQGLVPNDDFSAWLFAELPQICGRDRSKFAIQVFDLMIAHLGQSLQEPLWRESERGPETVADVLDRSFGNAQARTSYDRQQSALQDQVWENCTSLSRRINRYLMQGQ